MEAISGANAGGELYVPVIDERVACRRIGIVDVERCRECPYLVRLEHASAGPARFVVCAQAPESLEPDFAW